MGLCAINVSGLEDSFKPGNSMFFVKLRALCQIGYPFKILDLEQICSAFRSGCHDLRCDYFCKMVAVQELPEKSENCSLYFENAAKPLVANCQWTIIKENLRSH